MLCNHFLKVKWNKIAKYEVLILKIKPHTVWSKLNWTQLGKWKAKISQFYSKNRKLDCNMLCKLAKQLNSIDFSDFQMTRYYWFWIFLSFWFGICLNWNWSSSTVEEVKQGEIIPFQFSLYNHLIIISNHMFFIFNELPKQHCISEPCI